jgi:hypothetical protein
VISTAGATADNNSSEFDPDTYQLPPLQFDPLQERIIVNEVLKAETEMTGTLIDPKRTAAVSPGTSTIPAGSIIYYSADGVTTVFDKSGIQLFSANDAQAAMIPTPVGMIPATHVNTVPSGSYEYYSENATYIINNNEIVLVKLYEKTSTDDISSISRSSEGSSAGEQKILKSYTVETDQINSTLMAYAGIDNPVFYPGQTFTAQWIVPDPPLQSGNLSPTYVSIGLDEMNSYYGYTTWHNFRPIIEYDYDQNAWLMSACSYNRYYIWSWDALCTNKFLIHPGDKIEGRIEYNEDTSSSSTRHQFYAFIGDYNTGLGISSGSRFPVNTDTISQLNINLQGDVANMNESTIIGNVTFSPVNLPVSPTTYVNPSNPLLPHLNVENLWPDKIVFHTLDAPEPEGYTFSMTNIEMYANSSNNMAMSYPSNINWSGKPKKEPGTASCFNVSKWLEGDGWKLVFYHQNQSVTKEDFGTGGNGLNDAIFHFHSGHGDEGEILMYENSSYLQYSDVTKKWGKKNKWVMIDSCSVLPNESIGKRWGQALDTSHGILGFATEVQYEWDGTPYINKFFEYALKNNQTIMDAYRNSTIETAQPFTYGAAVFHNKYQFYHDHFPGHGEVAPDASPDEEPYYLSWQCGKTLNPWWQWW